MLTITIILFIILALVGLTIGYGISIYNNLISIKNNVRKAWANIDVLLKQRRDELIKLVETCQQYMGYEKSTLMQITQLRTELENARAAGDVTAIGNAEGALRKSLGSLFAVAENYPELKTNEVFLNLQTRISGLETAISDRREFYNDSVNVNNIKIAQFPDLIIAHLYAFGPAKLLEFDTEELRNPDLNTLFTSRPQD